MHPRVFGLLGALVLFPQLGAAQAPQAPAEPFPASDSEVPKEPRPEAHYIRAGIEEVLLLGVGAIWYWVNKDVNSKDWEYDNFADRLSADAIRFDNNNFSTNHILHTTAGGGYHVFARANGLPLWASASYTLVTSSLWEGLLEFKEKISINDSIVTPLGGVALGEALYQIGDYLNSAPGGGSTSHKAFGWTLGLPVALHDTIDGRVEPPGPTDNLGFSLRFWHRFELVLEATRVSASGENLADQQGLMFSASLVRMPGYLRPRRVRRWFASGDFTDLRFRVARLGSEQGELDLQVETILAGLYHQDFIGEPDDMEGIATVIGVSLGFEHMQRRGLGPFDRLALVHLPGLTLDIQHALGGDLWGRIRTTAHFDFAAMNALGYPTWQAENPDVRTKSVLEDQTYAYYGGVTTSVHMSLRWKGISVGGMGRYGFYDSIEGFDRHQEEIELDVATKEDIIEHHFWAGYQFEDPSLLLRLQIEDLIRRGSAEQVNVTRNDRRGVLQFGLAF